MPSHRHAILRRRSLLLALAGLALAVAAFFAIRALTGDEESELKVEDGDVELTIPKPDGWEALSEAERGRVPGEPLAVMRREGGQGVVVLNRQSGSAGDLRRLERQLDRRLPRGIRDFKKVNARTIEVEAGPALLYSYAREREGTAHTLLVVPAGDRSYSVNAAIPGGSQEAAAEVGRILRGVDL